MGRTARQIKLLEIIKSVEIYKQDELAILLREAGFKATQATISRDIKELGLIKVSTGTGYRYVVAESKEDKIANKRFNLFKDSVISVKTSQNIVVIKTLEGSANTAAALLDSLSIDEIMGTVAGDDTILIVVDKVENADYVASRLKDLL